MTKAVSRFCLGKKHAVSDARTLRADKYVDRRPIPIRCEYDHQVKRWPLYDNDTVGDCAIVAYAHLVACQTAVADGNGRLVEFKLPDVLRAYRELSPQDDGVVMLDALKYFRAKGVGGVHTGMFAAVDFHDVGLLFRAIHQYGGIYAGFLLPQAVVEMGTLWYAPATPAQLKGKWAVGSLGGHAVYLGGYDSVAGLLTGATWGKPLTLSLSFLRAYMDEAYVLVSEAWTNDLGDTPTGSNLRQLRYDVKKVTA